MVFKKQPAGTQRTLIYKVRLTPQVKEVIEKKLASMRALSGWEETTISELIRLAIWDYCKEADDPREP